MHVYKGMEKVVNINVYGGLIIITNIKINSLNISTVKPVYIETTQETEGKWSL